MNSITYRRETLLRAFVLASQDRLPIRKATAKFTKAWHHAGTHTYLPNSPLGMYLREQTLLQLLGAAGVGLQNQVITSAAAAEAMGLRELHPYPIKKYFDNHGVLTRADASLQDASREAANECRAHWKTEALPNPPVRRLWRRVNEDDKQAIQRHVEGIRDASTPASFGVEETHTDVESYRLRVLKAQGL